MTHLVDYLRQTLPAFKPSFPVQLGFRAVPRVLAESYECLDLSLPVQAAERMIEL